MYTMTTELDGKGLFLNLYLAPLFVHQTRDLKESSYLNI